MCLESTQDRRDQLKAGQRLAAQPLASAGLLAELTSRSTYNLPMNRDMVGSSQMPKQQVFELFKEESILKKLQRRN